MARMENHKYSIEEAFRECFYIVPDYQREYVWTDNEHRPRPLAPPWPCAKKGLWGNTPCRRHPLSLGR